jgi:hypothetical protein
MFNMGHVFFIRANPRQTCFWDLIHFSKLFFLPYAPFYFIFFIEHRKRTALVFRPVTSFLDARNYLALSTKWAFNVRRYCAVAPQDNVIELFVVRLSSLMHIIWDLEMGLLTRPDVYCFLQGRFMHVVNKKLDLYLMLFL